MVSCELVWISVPSHEAWILVRKWVWSTSEIPLFEGTDPEDTIVNAFKMFDPDAKGFIHKDE